MMELTIAPGAEDQPRVATMRAAKRSARTVAIQSMRYCARHEMILAIARYA
jgi:hypothetical protein